MVEWFGEFFATLPEVLVALYQFFDPGNEGRGWVGLLLGVLWIGGLGIVPLALARRLHGTREWVSATLGIMGASSLLWWLHGVLPHIWIQFTQSNNDLLSGTIIPASAGIDVSDDFRLDLASNLYGVITESVVGGLMVGGIVITLWALLRAQRALPAKTLASGEIKPEAGGYK